MDFILVLLMNSGSFKVLMLNETTLTCKENMVLEFIYLLQASFLYDSRAVIYFSCVNVSVFLFFLLNLTFFFPGMARYPAKLDVYVELTSNL